MSNEAAYGLTTSDGRLFCWTHRTFHREGEMQKECVGYRGGKLDTMPKPELSEEGSPNA